MGHTGAKNRRKATMKIRNKPQLHFLPMIQNFYKYLQTDWNSYKLQVGVIVFYSYFIYMVTIMLKIIKLTILNLIWYQKNQIIIFYIEKSLSYYQFMYFWQQQHIWYIAIE